MNEIKWRQERKKEKKKKRTKESAWFEMKSSRNRSAFYSLTFFGIKCNWTKQNRTTSNRQQQQQHKTYHNIWQTITLISVHKLLIGAFFFYKTSDELYMTIFHMWACVFGYFVLLTVMHYDSKDEPQAKNEK